MSKRKRSEGESQASQSQYFNKKPRLDDDDEEQEEEEAPKSSGAKKKKLSDLAYKGSISSSSSKNSSSSSSQTKPKKQTKKKVIKNEDEDEEPAELPDEEEEPTPKPKSKSTSKTPLTPGGVKDILANIKHDEKRHKEFSKVLGAVPSWQITGKKDDDDEQTKKEVAGYENTNAKFTPLEKQFLEIRKQYPGVVLFVEHGYRYKFFGKDAATAADVLKVQSYFAKNFLTASVPVPRFHIHARRLIQAGYKVGVVSQTETAALKAVSSTKNQLFTRAVSALYTKSTFIGQDIDPLLQKGGTDNTDDVLEENSPKFVMGNYLMCIAEDSEKKQLKTAVVAVQTSTGDIIYDYFEDGFMRRELETRLTHISPIEILVPDNVTDQTEKLIRHFNPSNKKDDTVSIERYNPKELPIASAASFINDLFSIKSNSSKKPPPKKSSKKQNDSDDEDEDDNEDDEPDDDRIIQAKKNAHELVRSWNPLLITCFATLAKYAKKHKLESLFFLDCNYSTFESQKYMKLDGTAIKNMEILQAEGAPYGKGTLFWVVNRTITSMGRRLLVQWLQRPLYNIPEIEARNNAVEELIMAARTPPLSDLFGLLGELPDLERGICRIYYKKCSAKEFISVLEAFKRLVKTCPSPDSVKSTLLKSLLESIPKIDSSVKNLLQMVNMNKLKEYENALEELLQKQQQHQDEEGEEEDVKKDEMTVTPADLLEDDMFPKMAKCKKEIKSLEKGFEDELKKIKTVLADPKQKFVTKNKEEYVIEVKNAHLGRVPTDWKSVAETKTLKRYRTPYCINNLPLLNQQRETLHIESKRAWETFLESFGKDYASFRACTQTLATLDCLHSFSIVSQQEGFIKPTLVKPTPSAPHRLHIKEGRHPVILAINADVVPNTVHFGPKDNGSSSSSNNSNEDDTNNSVDCMVLTGPNMGGKTSFCKMAGLIAILAQIGCFVPADECVLTPIDAIYTRMGAHDNMTRGESTFLVELMETGRMLRQATSRSLLILDELGRGTSTHDGVAIAFGTLSFLLSSLKPITLFVTHFPSLKQLAERFPTNITFHHMGFFKDDEHGNSTITFLYKLNDGIEGRSYGLNVARLANLHPQIIQRARHFSLLLEQQVMTRQFQHIFKSLILGSLDAFPSKETLFSYQTTLKFLFKQASTHKDLKF